MLFNEWLEYVLWLIYTYHHGSGEIIAYIKGKTEPENGGKAQKTDGNTHYRIRTDDWQGFIKAFIRDCSRCRESVFGKILKAIAVQRHHIRRAFRKACCFPKKRSYVIIEKSSKSLSSPSTMATFDT